MIFDSICDLDFVKSTNFYIFLTVAYFQDGRLCVRDDLLTHCVHDWYVLTSSAGVAPDLSSVFHLIESS